MIDIIELNERLPRKAGYCYVPMVPSHVNYMQITDPDWVPTARAVSVEQMLESQSRLGLAVTALVNGSPVAMFGCIMLWPGVAELWSILTDDVRRHPKHLTQVGRAFSDISAQSLRLHRLQMTVRSDDERALRWSQFLGFEAEGVMKKYTPDAVDSYILARVT